MVLSTQGAWGRRNGEREQKNERESRPPPLTFFTMVIIIIVIINVQVPANSYSWFARGVVYTHTRKSYNICTHALCMCVERGRKLCRMRGTKQINRVRRQIRTPLQTRCVNTRRKILLLLCLYCLLSKNKRPNRR